MSNNRGIMDSVALRPARRGLVLALIAPAVVLGALAGHAQAQEASGDDPKCLYSSSVVGTDFDFIRETDPSAFKALKPLGKGLREMPDKTQDAELRQEAFAFLASFKDGAHVTIAVDAEFGSEALARKEALRYTPRLGRLPSVLRLGVKRLVVHKGGPNATAFSDQGLIVVYSENATKRIATHDLEETIFHESVHATWDSKHAKSARWRKAQKLDGRFLTDYGRKNPQREDLAESALFAYTLVRHPKRIPPVDAEKVRRAIPARIAFVRTLLPPEK